MNVYVACTTTLGPSWPNDDRPNAWILSIFLVHSCVPDRHQPLSRHGLSPAGVGGERRSSNRFAIMPRIPTQPRQDDLRTSRSGVGRVAAVPVEDSVRFVDNLWVLCGRTFHGSITSKTLKWLMREMSCHTRKCSKLIWPWDNSSKLW